MIFLCGEGIIIQRMFVRHSVYVCVVWVGNSQGPDRKPQFHLTLFRRVTHTRSPRSIKQEHSARLPAYACVCAHVRLCNGLKLKSAHERCVSQCCFSCCSDRKQTLAAVYGFSKLPHRTRFQTWCKI